MRDLLARDFRHASPVRVAVAVAPVYSPGTWSSVGLRPYSGTVTQNDSSSRPRPPHERPWLASYAADVPDDIPEQTGSLGDLVEASAASYPDAVALEFFGSTTTYTELEALIARAAAGLRALGVRAGDPVALMLPNCPQHIVAFYAVLGWAPSSSSTIRSTPPKSSATSSRTTARRSRSSGTRSPSTCRTSRPTWRCTRS